MRSRADTSRAREAGFTLVELLIALVIIAVLVVILMIGLSSARTATRNDAMQAAGATFDQAFGALNRISPPMPDPQSGAFIDPIDRIPAAGMTANPADPNTGLADESGEWLIQEWPRSPYAPGGVRLRRGATSATCTVTSPQPGDVAVCRRSATRRGQYEVVAWGRDGSGAPAVVYRAQH